jgi:hypothetical protein
LVPSSPPRFLGVVGGAYVPAAVGAHVWLAGAHLLPHGGGGTWPGTGSGFGWGDGGDATCVAARRETRETGEKKTALVSRRTSSARARFVSSALVACEVPDVFEELEELEELFFGGEADVRLRAAVGEGGAESSRSEESNDSFYRERDKDEDDAFVVARALRGVSVSSAEGLEFLPAEGGALVRVAWRGVGSLGDAPRDPNWFACAFGSIAPVAFRAGPGPGPGPGPENAGVCASPATRARRAEPQLAGESKFRNFDFGVAYPGFGRARFDAETPKSLGGRDGDDGGRRVDPFSLRGAPRGGNVCSRRGIFSAFLLERRRGGLERANGIVRVRLGTRRRDDDDDEGGFGSGFGFVRFAVCRARRVRDAPDRKSRFRRQWRRRRRLRRPRSRASRVRGSQGDVGDAALRPRSGRVRGVHRRRRFPGRRGV